MDKNNCERFFISILLILIQLGFAGVQIILTRFGKDIGLDEMMFVFVRDFIAAIIILPLTILAERTIMVPCKREIPVFLAMGFFGHFVSRISAVYGVYFTNASIATLIMSLLPIWTYIFAACARIEKLPNIRTTYGFGKTAGVFLGVLGSVLITAGADFTPNRNISIVKKIFGYVLLFVNGASTATYFLLQKKYIYTKDDSRWQKKPFNVLIWNYIFGQVYLFLGNIYNIVYRPEAFTDIKFEALYAFLYCVLVQSVFCFAAMTWANMKMRSTFVTSFWPLYGIFGLFLGYLVLDERLSGVELSGATIILISLPCVIWGNFREDIVKEAEENKTILSDEGLCDDDNQKDNTTNC